MAAITLAKHAISTPRIQAKYHIVVSP